MKPFRAIISLIFLCLQNNLAQLLRILLSGQALCFLPLSLNQDIIRDLGTRHRAGIGMSENSDAVVVIVSEETGQISTSLSGKLVTGYDETTLRAFLENELINDTLYQKIRRRRGEKKE